MFYKQNNYVLFEILWAPQYVPNAPCPPFSVFAQGRLISFSTLMRSSRVVR